MAALAGPNGGLGSYMLDDADACVSAPPYEEPGGGGEGQYYLVDPDTVLEAAHATDVVE